MGLLISVVLTSLLGFSLCIWFANWIKNQCVQGESVRHVASLIERGSLVFLRREMLSLLGFCSLMALLLALLLPQIIFIEPSLANLTVPLAYLCGCSLSALCALIGMKVATKANARTAEAAQTSLESAFLISFRGGSVMGIFVVCTSLLGITLLLRIGADAIHLFAFSFGASSLALFAKAGGGIFTKTADISADLVGKVELGLAEDDPRNPAVIADNVGDNVGDVAGMGCDLFDSYVASLIASLVMAFSLNKAYVSLILAYSLCGMASTILVVGSVRLGAKRSVSATLNRNTWGTSMLFLVSSLIVTLVMEAPPRLYLCSVVGLGVGTLIGLITNHYTDDCHSPVQKVAAMGKQGPAFTVLGGFSYGLLSTLPALIGIALAALLSYVLASPLGEGMGFFGISLSSVGMLSIVGMVVSNDAYGPIVDNARGLVQMCDLGDTALEHTDHLDSAGNTAKAVTKGFAIAAAGLAVLSLLGAFLSEVNAHQRMLGMPVTVTLDLFDPRLFFGLIVGSSIPAAFSALLIRSVQQNAMLLVGEIHRQFSTIKGLSEGKKGVMPDYDACIDLATTLALKKLLASGVFIILSTLAVGWIGGPVAVGGFIMGNIISGLLLALFMATSGGLWDNAKKYVEAGHEGGKQSQAHRSAVIGDTIGDPLKDTAGPSINTQITLVTLVASLCASLFLRYSLF